MCIFRDCADGSDEDPKYCGTFLIHAWVISSFQHLLSLDQTRGITSTTTVTTTTTTTASSNASVGKYGFDTRSEISIS